jgi:hypothetical protein
MTSADPHREHGLPPGTTTASPVWTRLRCSRCRYVAEHPGPVSEGDLDRDCGLCGAMLGAVTVFRVSETENARRETFSIGSSKENAPG